MDIENQNNAYVDVKSSQYDTQQYNQVAVHPVYDSHRPILEKKESLSKH